VDGGRDPAARCGRSAENLKRVQRKRSGAADGSAGERDNGALALTFRRFGMLRGRECKHSVVKGNGHGSNG
jgi:hypothetical protein